MWKSLNSSKKKKQKEKSSNDYNRRLELLALLLAVAPVSGLPVRLRASSNVRQCFKILTSSNPTVHYKKEQGLAEKKADFALFCSSRYSRLTLQKCLSIEIFPASILLMV